MRIVSLLPSATEIVCALGLDEHLVAVSHECDFPPQVARLPRVTSSIIPEALSAAEIDRAVVEAVRSGDALYKVDAELLSRLAPDLIVTQGICDVCAVNVGTVRESLTLLADVLVDGVETLSLSGKTFEGVLRDVSQLATATGTRADALLAHSRVRWQALAARARAHRPSVLVLEWPEPFYFGGHWVPEMVQVAGGEDLFGTPGEDSGRLDQAQLRARDPDIVVSAACGYGLDINDRFACAFKARPELSGLRAVKSGAVWAVDANSYFSRPTLRIIDGAEILEGILGADALAVVPGARRAIVE